MTALITRSDEDAYENLRQLQNLTRIGDQIIDAQGAIWEKNERNWWNSHGWRVEGEVVGSFFFDYHIRVWPYKLKAAEVKLPHSRACGWAPHDHGPQCHSNCPTCEGK